MNVKIKVILAISSFLIITAVLYSAGGESGITTDRLYALKLGSEPVEADWNAAVPAIVLAQNGNLNKLNKTSRVGRLKERSRQKRCRSAQGTEPTKEM